MVLISIYLAVTAHCDSALCQLQARLPVLFSLSPRACCLQTLAPQCLAGERSIEDSATCWLCCVVVTAQSMTVHCRPCVRSVLC